MSDNTFRLTYATMYNPPDELHSQYEEEVVKLKGNAGKEYAMIINNQDISADEKFNSHSPINTDLVLGVFQQGTAQHAKDALTAAKNAFQSWGRTPWQERVELVRKAASVIDQRVFELGAILSMEVGKNRMEALADAAEAADLMRYSCDQMEENNGYIVKMEQDPLEGYTATNHSVLRPYGVWVVISPFNFPAALTGGPVGAALVAGNTVVMKSAPDTPLTVRILAECFRQAGFPDGVVNLVTGPNETVGQTLVDSPLMDGITFTGSYNVGMMIYRSIANGPYPRPTLLEMGGKNPTIISKTANLERASQGLMRSAFGLQGQKCSAASRIFVEESAYDELVERLVKLTNEIKVGDPTLRETFMGPVINQRAYQAYQDYAKDLSQSGNILTGGKTLQEGDLGKGYFVAPSVVTKVEDNHKLWKHEMFVPITMVTKIKNIEEGMQRANDVDYGLTAGFYGDKEQTEWFFDNIEAGVTYANRPQGATTGAWPGFQPFGGWKASGSSGKNAGGHYYLPLYMHEQSHSVIE